MDCSCDGRSPVERPGGSGEHPVDNTDTHCTHTVHTHTHTARHETQGKWRKHKGGPRGHSCDQDSPLIRISPLTREKGYVQPAPDDVTFKYTWEQFGLLQSEAPEGRPNKWCVS